MKFINQLITLFISLNLIISQTLFANLSPIKTNKDLYSTNISSNIDASVDMRLFTKEGLEHIKQEAEQIKNGIKLLAFNVIYKNQIKEAKEFQEKFINKLIKLKETDIQKYNEVVNGLKEFATKKENLKEQYKKELGPGILAVPPILVWFSSYLSAPTDDNEIYSGPTETALLTPIVVVGNSGKVAGELTAYEIAKIGGKNFGFYKNYLNKSTKEIEKGIKSLEKQIQEHIDKISNPQKYIKDFDKLDVRQQENLINKKWNSDIARQKEQKQILEQILRERMK